MSDDNGDTAADAALSYISQAEKLCMTPPENTGARKIDRVGVIGLGTMGVGISTALLCAEIPVVAVETSQAAADRAVSTIQKNVQRLAERGKIDASNVAKICQRLSVSLERSALSGCDMVIEAAFEDFQLKKDIAGWLAPLLKPGAIIATNTSTLDVDEIGKASTRPQDLIGMHFFSPAHIMRLVEVIAARETAQDVVQATRRLAIKMSKVPVVCGVSYGFIGNRMAEVYMRETEFLLMEGATPEQIDGVVQSAHWLGMAMGPCRMLDMAGIDVGARTVIENIKQGGFPPDPAYRPVCQELFALGRFGQKAKLGYYSYPDKAPEAEPMTETLSIELAAKFDIKRRAAIESKEIFERLFFSMVNEAAKILEEGIATRASDIDVVWALGYGFPKERGGPLYMAAQIGLASIVSTLDGYAVKRGNQFGYWSVSPLLRRLANEGQGFAELDRKKKAV